MRAPTGLGIALAAAVVALGAAPASAAPLSPQAPSAISFGRIFVSAANRYSAQHGGSARVSQPHCVEPRPGSYMCAYTVGRNGAATCHLMQARWTPRGASTISVTLAGRTTRCATLEQAIQSLR